MSNTRNDRVIALLKTLGISEMELSRRTGKQPTNIYRITRKQGEPTPSTLQVIATACNANFDWLLTGHGEMLKPDPTDPAPANAVTSLYQDEVYTRLKEENSRLVKEAERLWQLLGMYTSGVKPNFLKASKGTDSRRVIKPRSGELLLARAA